jgi:hypothetical protein
VTHQHARDCVVAPALFESLHVDLLSEAGCYTVVFHLRIEYESTVN